MRARRQVALSAVSVLGLGLTCALLAGCVDRQDRNDAGASGQVARGWDFDADEHPEVVVATADSRELWVYPGGGRGRAGGPEEKLTAAELDVPGEHFAGFGDVGSGDVDGDGHDDLVVCLRYYRLDQETGGHHWSRLGVALGGEQGLSALLPMEPERRGREGCGEPTLADLDGDGYDDTIAVSGDQIRWTSGMPDVGPDTEWEWRRITKPFVVDGVIHRDFRDLELGDVNGDGRLDLLHASNGVATPEGEAAGGRGVTLRLGTEDGFGAPDTSTDRSETVAARLGDVDADGFDDLVTYRSELDFDRAEDSAYGAVVQVRYGSERGPRPPGRARTVLGLGETTKPVQRVSFPKHLDERAQELRVADLDRDGAEDIVLRAVMPHSDTPAVGTLLVVPGGDRSERPRPYVLSKSEASFTLKGRSWEQSVQVRQDSNEEVTELVAIWTTPGDDQFGYVFDRRDLRRREGNDDEPRPATEAAAPWDFAGDGERSLVIEAPNVDPDGAALLFGLSDGAGSVEGGPAEGRRLAPQRARDGWPIGGDSASGDFDADGHADLAVCGNQGMLVFFGSPDGLDEDAAVPVQTAEDAHPCEGLVSGDVDADGFDDLLLAGGAAVGWAAGGPDTRSIAGW